MAGKVTVIIPYRKRDVEPDHLQRCLSCVKKLHDLGEIIIVNNDETPMKLDDSAGIQVINVNYPMWNSAWARNIAIRHAKCPYIANIDADVMVRPSYLTTGIDVLSKQHAYIRRPWGTNKDNWQKIFDLPWSQKLKQTKYKMGGADGMLITKKEFLVALCGYNEMLGGWGRGDNDTGNRLRSSGKKVKIADPNNDSPIHLWHDKTFTKRYPVRDIINDGILKRLKYKPDYWGQISGPWTAGCQERKDAK